jgi:LPXTG-motif cell wall-anchored protein
MNIVISIDIKSENYLSKVWFIPSTGGANVTYNGNNNNLWIILGIVVLILLIFGIILLKK